MPNRLAQETSPYLLQHADNPVDWQPWDAAALAQAQREDRPILLSIGYSACHWCHVMAHESFEDAEVAATMNRLFVNIKVDREERPDLDQIYQVAQQMLNGRNGGWPLTMFLAPDGVPFFGGTYFPPLPRHGLPAFGDLCERVAAAWKDRREDAIKPQSAILRDALAKMTPASENDGTALHKEPLIDACRTLARVYDSHYGGFGSAPKFPHPGDLAFLLRRSTAEGNDAWRDMALTTLRRMAEGGIYDQVGGGFCRYSVDGRWEIPHFEKMLYDNGPLLGLYADAFVITGEPLFKRVAEETADWVMREMQSPEGGFYSSLDADSEGEEGKYYVWTPAEVRAVLDDAEWAVAARHWCLDGPPNFENSHWHLRVAKPLVVEDRELIAGARAKLYMARENRVRPGRDDKILTSWNALMIAGLVHAGRLLARPAWIAAARRALAFIEAKLWQGEGGHLLATCKDGRAHLNAYLDDYAYLLAALLELLQADFRREELDFASDVADALLARFEDVEHGGFFFTAHDHETLIARLKPATDGSTPAGNGIAAVALQRLGHLLGEPRYIDAAERTLRLFRSEFEQRPGGLSALLTALDEALDPPQVVILRGPDGFLQSWQESLSREFRPSTMVLAIACDMAHLPATLDKPISADVNAWVCTGVNCLPPVRDLVALQQILTKFCKHTEKV
jgi:uncharacterized protein YyaL (SSP411 family)